MDLVTTLSHERPLWLRGEERMLLPVHGQSSFQDQDLLIEKTLVLKWKVFKN